jgi:hypothetical protein
LFLDNISLKSETKNNFREYLAIDSSLFSG